MIMETKQNLGLASIRNRGGGYLNCSVASCRSLLYGCMHGSGLWQWGESVRAALFQFPLSILQDSKVPGESDNG